jgi:hypothetical protein
MAAMAFAQDTLRSNARLDESYERQWLRVKTDLQKADRSKGQCGFCASIL